MKHTQYLLSHYVALVFVLVAMVIGAGVYVVRNINDKPAVEVAQNTQINEDAIKNNPEQKSILSGTFTDADAIHKGSGDAKVIIAEEGPLLIFEDDFKTTSGPDLFVYLSPNEAGEELGNFVSLGELKSTEGYQVYTLPTNYADYKSVVVWCRAFGTTFTAATLQ